MTSDLEQRLRSLSPRRRALFMVELRNRARARGLSSPIQPRRDPQHWPLSFAQERMWLLQQLDPASPAYTFVSAYQLDGALDTTLLEAALTEVFRRHDIFRTRYPSIDGRPACVVVAPASISLPVEVVSEAEVVRVVAEEGRQPFDLAGPLTRIRLLRARPDRHVLLLAAHHVVADGWCIGVLIRELGELYRSLAQGEPTTLAEPPIQYVDFAAWQREWLSGERLQSQLTYWKEHLAAPLPILDLPTDHPRDPARQSHLGARCSRVVAPSLRSALREQSERQRVTPFMIWLAAWAALLHRYTGDPALIVGVPVANRIRPELERLLGLFMNTLGLRIDVDGDPSFSELLARVRHTSLSGFAHQDAPFELVVDSVQSVRDVRYSPVFQTLFVFNDVSQEAIAIPALDIRRVDVDQGTARYDLVLEVSHGRDAMTTTLVYRTDLFLASTIERWLGHLHTLLAQALSDPERPISHLDLMSEEERAQMLRIGRGPRIERARETVQELFARAVARAPGAPAIISASGELSYAQLGHRVESLAGALAARRIQPAMAVGLCARRSPDTIAAVLAIMKAGAAVVPLDPEHPRGRLSEMITTADVRLVLVDAACAPLLQGAGVPLLVLGGALEDAAPRVDVDPERPAYVLFTSGSTGSPKGCSVPHRALVNRLQAVAEILQLGPDDRVLHKTPMAFDVAMGEMLLPFVAGAALVLAEPDRHGDLPYLIDLIRRQRVTYTHFVPSLFRLFLESSGVEELTSLRHVWCGGEVLSPRLVRRFFERLRARLYNGYGPTEAAIGVTIHVCTPADGETDAPVPIGRPIANSQLYVVDRGLRLVPLGVEGELCIGGTPLADGYVGNPEQTRALFVDDPFGGGRMYRTGDRARLMPDGNIMFLGRRDHQVKIRGQRVELEEIERVIGRHPAVRQVVVRVDRSAGDGRLVAHVVVSASVISDEELKQFAAERLPSAMLPSAFDRLDALPLNVHGKIDRDALARRALPAPASSSAYEAPETRLQEQIARVWKETLGVDRVGLHDNFFDIGGHSLAVLQVHTRLSALLERSLHPMDLFRHPTIAAMAEFLEGRTQEQAGAEQGRQRAARTRDALLRFRKPSGGDGEQR